MLKRVFVLCLICFCFSFVVKGNTSIAKILSTLESKTKDVSSIQTKFIQTKKLAVFTKEITIEGMVYIKKPNLFAWHVYKPVRYGLVVKGTEVSQWDSDTNQVQTISMKNNPAFSAIFEQMNGWLSGNYKSFMNDYKITVVGDGLQATGIRHQKTNIQLRSSSFEGQAEHLILKFAPLKSAASYKFIKSITLYFGKDPRYIKKFVIKERNGDQTTLNFLNTKLNAPIPSNAWNAKD